MARRPDPAQSDWVEAETTRTALDAVLAEARVYSTSQAYLDLLDFVVRLRTFAPFNAMLLQIQKPGLTYAASTSDWGLRFGRRPKRDARPLIILRPFGPVDLVYDVLDTEGDPLPEDAAMFPARGPVDAGRLILFQGKMEKKGIKFGNFDAGDGSAGHIRLIHRPSDKKKPSTYHVGINQNHTPPTQFVTLLHELGHLFLGHLGRDDVLKIPGRRGLPHPTREVEAESVAVIVARRHGVEHKPERYLRTYVDKTEALDIYTILRAAGQVEQLLGLDAASTRTHTRGTLV